MTFNLLIFYLIAAAFVLAAHGLTVVTIFLSRKYQGNISDTRMAAGFFASAILFIAASCFIIRVVRVTGASSIILVYMFLFFSILSVQQGFSRISFKHRAIQWFLNILFCACLSLISSFLLK